MGLIPPDDPFLIQVTLFGLALNVRWYGAIIMSGALLAAWLAARRAAARGIDPEHVWNQLFLGLIFGIVGARLYYVAFEWQRFASDPLAIINLTTGGLAIHGAIIGALLSALIYTRVKQLPLWEWLDICVPGFLLAQAIGRWGNFFNQEAYGSPTSLGFGVLIAPEHRIPPYNNLTLYPPDTLFHATFLYESLWNLVGVALLLWLDRRYGTHAPTVRRRLNGGDLVFLYAIYYSAGRFWIEGLRTDSLYAGPIRVAQLVSLALIGLGLLALVVNHLWRRRAPQGHAAEQQNAATGSPQLGAGPAGAERSETHQPL